MYQEVLDKALEYPGTFMERLSFFMTSFTDRIEKSGLKLCQEWVRNTVDPDLVENEDDRSKLAFDNHSLTVLLEDGIERGELASDAPVSMVDLYLELASPTLARRKPLSARHAKEAYRRMWKYNCADFDKLDDNAAGVPISGIIRAYNSLLIQPNPYFGAELNYYKTFRSAYDRTFETADYSAQTEVIGGAFDVNEALREAIEFQAKNGF